MKIAWEDTEIRERGVTVPEWIEQDITESTICAIQQGGCESGAYMPAVTYYDATQTMAHHGDEITEFLADMGLEVSHVDWTDTSWGMFCCRLVSYAVEGWAAQFECEE